jgi:DNA-binding IclR family transcriptional regulator
VSESDGSGVKSAERALTILELFSRSDRALTFTQVAELLGYPRSSLHGLLRTLTTRGWLRLDPTTRRFTLGMRAWEAGAAHRPAAELARRAQPVVDRLGASLGGAVCVAVLDGTDVVTVACSGLDRDRRVAAQRVAAGRVLLADLDRPLRSRHLAEVAADGDDVHRDLDRVRSQGWADASAGDGDRSLAVPVRDEGGTVVAALALLAPAARLGDDSLESSRRTLRQGAEQLAAAMVAQPAG